MSKEIRNLLLAIVLFGAFIFVIYYSVFNENDKFKKYMSGELVNISYPETSFLVEKLRLSFKNLSIPHWNQYSSAGSPTISQSGIYYLPNYLLKIPYKLNQNYLPFAVYQWFVLLHLLIAAVGIYLLLKRMLISNQAAILGGMFFIVSGLMIEITWVNFIVAVSLLPWILLFLDLSKNEKGYPWVLLASFFTFQQLAVSPQFALYTLIFVALLTWVKDEFTQPKRIIQIVMFYVLTILYSSVLLLPLKELNEIASFRNYLNYDYVDMLATRAIDIFQIVIFSPSQNFVQIFTGVIPILMTVILLATYKDKFDYKLVGIAFAIFLFSTNNMLFQPLVRLIPFLNETRWFSRTNELVVFVLMVLTVKSIDTFKPDFKRDTRIAAVIGVIAVLGYSLGQKYDPQGYHVNQVVFPLMLIGVFVLLLYGWKEKFINEQKLKYMIGILILFDLSRSLVGLTTYQFSQYKLHKTGGMEKSEWFFKQTSRSQIRQDEFRLPADQYMKDGYNKFLLNKEYAGGSANRVGNEFSPAILKKYDDYLKVAKSNTSLLIAANISYGAGALPRSYLVSCYKYAPSDRDALIQMTDLDFSGEKYIILNDRPKSADITEVFSSKECPVSYSHVNYRQTDDEINYDSIVTNKSQLLFISDNWYPGWNVYVNGSKSEPLIANYTFKAVEIPSGSSNVQFKFEPKSNKIGGLITLLSLFISVLSILAFSLFKRWSAVKITEKNLT